MSCEGTVTGAPSEGFSRLLGESRRNLHSAWASTDKGKCTAIWSPSKSALYAVHTNGCSFIALPSTSTGSKAWIPSLWRVGARFSITGCSLITSSNTSQTSGISLSTIFLADFILCAVPLPTSSFITKGLNSSIAISLGRPHWYIFNSGPTTITERPE